MLDLDRKKLGRFLASQNQIKKENGVWLVPSENDNHKYEVRTGLKGRFCNCPDFEQRNQACKHVYAVEILVKARKARRKLKQVSPPIIKRPTYPQAWAAYNEAQTHEKEMVEKLLRELCRGIVQPPQENGKPRIVLSDLIFSATMKVYGTLSGRRSSTDLRECEEKNLIRSAPHYNTISKYLNYRELSVVLKRLIEESAKPLSRIEDVFATDTTGFHSATYSKWFDKKYGKKVRQQNWLKLHVSVGVKTHIVTFVEITPPDQHDTTKFRSLIKGTAKNFDITEVLADKAYLSRKNLAFVDKLGATAYIPFKTNTTGRGPDLWRKMYHFFQYNREAFENHYHQRSNAETAIWMIKSKFSEGLRSKNEVSQRNELLCKILCHNLAVLVQSSIELGIDPDFWKNAA